MTSCKTVRIEEMPRPADGGSSMSLSKRLLIGFGVVLGLLLVLVLIVSVWEPAGPQTKALAINVGDRTLTVGGHYKAMKQESLPEGIKIVVDAHQIALENEQLTIDGQTRVLGPGEDVVAWIREDGRLDIKVEKSATPPAE